MRKQASRMCPTVEQKLDEVWLLIEIGVVFGILSEYILLKKVIFAPA